MDIRQSAIDRTKRFEGLAGTDDAVSYFYLDPDGNVTIGYGHLVADAAAAAPLAMTQGNKAATEAEKRAAWTTVSAAKAGHPAPYYENLTTVRMSEQTAETLLTDDLKQAAKDLKKRFASLDTYPEEAQDALLDMIFNIGLPRFNKTDWKNLFAAVEAKDWKNAAAESNRKAIPKERNDAIKALFLTAASPLMPLGSAVDHLMHKRIDDLMRLMTHAEAQPNLFPYGVTRVRLAIEADGANVSLDLEGPARPDLKA